MKPILRHAVAPFAVLLSTAVLAQAHPGHDGHDFTWDFGHLAAYPGATILCVGLVGGGGVGDLENGAGVG